MFISTDIHGDLKTFYCDGLTAKAEALKCSGFLIDNNWENIHFIYASLTSIIYGKRYCSLVVSSDILVNCN